MKDIITFCDKTIGKTNEDIKNAESTFKSATEKEEFEPIESAIKTDEESTKHLLQQKKFKTFNTLKHKPQASHKETNLKENKKGWPTRTYANTLVQGPRRRSPSQENKKKLKEINLQMLLVQIQAQTIYRMKSQHQLRRKSNF